MAIYFYKEPKDGEIPPRPLLRDIQICESLFELKAPVVIHNKVVHPIGYWRRETTDYFTTRIKAQAACNKLNIPINKRNKLAEAEMLKRNQKLINDWDAKYGDK